jgi:2,3-dihydroxybiphenyl 1,2-dioxygenase
VAAGVPVHPHDYRPNDRPAARVASFTDPFGFRHELTAGLADGGQFEPSRPMDGFVTGQQGLGHVVLFVPDLAPAEAFLTGALGLRLSDTITAGRTVIRFFHCASSAARHHTVAITAVPGMVGLHHLMLEVRSLDDVGVALDRAEAMGGSMAMGLGRHPNDLMTSFYVRTPSGFEVEYGTGGLVVDDAAWEERAFESQSLWGHRPPASGRLIPGVLHPFEPQGAGA